MLSIHDKVFKNCVSFADFGFSITNGSVLGLTEAFVYEKRVLPDSLSPYVTTVLRGDDVRGFQIVGGSDLLVLPENLSDDELKDIYPEAYKKLRIYESYLKERADGDWYRPNVKVGVKGCVYVRSSIRWYAVYIDKEDIVLNDAMKLVNHELSKCLVAIFNSKFMDRWFNVFYASNVLNRSTVKDNRLVNKVPIPNNLVEYKERLEYFVDTIQTNKMLSIDTLDLELELESMILEMYNISLDEFLVIENEMFQRGLGK